MDQAVKDRLIKFIEDHGAKHWSFAARKDAEFIKFVEEQTADLQDVDFSTRVYVAVSNTNPSCEKGGIRKIKSIIHALDHGWAFCGTAGKCECARESVSNSCKVTLSEKSKDDISVSNAKRVATNIAKYGVSNTGQIDTAISAHKAFYADPEKVTEVVAKVEATMTKTYGVRNALQLQKVNEYRIKLASILTEEQKKSKKEKQRKKSDDGIYLSFSYDKLKEKFQTSGFLFLTSKDQYEGVGGGITNKRYQYQFKCLRCLLEFPDYIYDGHMPLCPKCDEKAISFRSKPEIEIAEYLKSIGVDDLIINSQKFIKEELDMYSPKYAIAVEHDGLWWHSEYASRERKTGSIKDRWFHFNKMKKCNDIGVRLVSIFGDEWQEKKDLCKLRLAHIFGKTEQKIYARKTVVQEITLKQSSTFLKKHHIQGDLIGKNMIHIGLFYEEELVSVMTFGEPRSILNQKKYELELYRFASKYSIVGGASKLFSYFLKVYNPNNVVSSCNLRWGDGLVYQKLGFDLDHFSDPGYFWVKNYTKRYHRSNFTKKKLVTQGYDSNKSETEIMLERGFDRIWDCGQLCYVWTKK